MAEEISTCPQCGATVILPAQYCVTCGIKLPESSHAFGSDTPLDPHATWKAADLSGWTTPPPGAFDFDDPTIIDVEPIPVTTPAPASRWASWPSATTEARIDETPVTEAITTPVAEAAAPSGTEEEAEKFEIVTSEPEEAEVTPIEPEPAETSEPLVESASVEPESDLEPLDTDTADPEPEPPAAAEVIEIEDDFEAAGWDEADEITEIEEPAVIPVTASEAPASGEAVERARALLDELRTLLPALTTPVPPTAEPTAAELDRIALRDAAIAARGEASFDDFSALRQTLSDATTRPRDVEVMLRLSQRVGDVAALLAERDRLQAAFDDLIAQLNGGS
jgi:hypothetical protein